eukprot:TRINITY_DN2803_c0_g2_i1.p1 TRINITY_DN2803_c0_g2~~TRINITY_DN2803_c0_g2_i1.p1  ORF type:complete len:592 (+),score=165.43 TRINITY_DN2803_c0_g2_i1:76-1776(+)
MNTLPCGHSTKVPCHQNPIDVVCKAPCQRSLVCGHPCKKTCGEDCTSQCMIHMKKLLPCGHQQKIPCHLPPADAKCNHPCRSLLDCSHTCTGTCGSCSQGKDHKLCSHKCGRSLVCGHQCSFPCLKDCPPCNEPCRNYCPHSHCTSKCGELCVPCNMPCDWSCVHHSCSKLCHEDCDRPPCNEPCQKLLSCGHPCAGLCGEDCPPCPQCNPEITELVLGHEDEPDARFIQLKDCKCVFEVRDMDQYMKVDNMGNPLPTNSSSSPMAIKPKICAKCQKEIRRSLRYGNIVKSTCRDIETVKQRILDQEHRVQLANVDAIDTCSMLIREWKMNKGVAFRLTGPTVLPINRLKKEATNRRIPMNAFDLVNTKLQLLKELHHTFTKHKLEFDPKTGRNDIVDSILREMSDLIVDIMSLTDCGSQSEKQDRITWIGTRFDALSVIKLSNHEYVTLATKHRANNLSSDVRKRISTNMTRILRECSIEKTKAFKRSIIEAIGLPKGHWYKCPNGHVYCIDACGGAMEKSHCIECGASIGGDNHVLTSGNQHAGEFDESNQAAWGNNFGVNAPR